MPPHGICGEIAHSAQTEMAAPGPASIPSFIILAPIVFLACTAMALAAEASSEKGALGAYPAIFVFGDSLSDAGNGFLSGSLSAVRTSQLPYGETFPGWPAGRYSDGHVLVDLLAIHLDLPMLSPYLNSSASFEGGVNYAVGGATAINTSMLATMAVYPHTNLSLGVQLSWHLELLAKVQASNGLFSGSPAKSSFLEGLYVIEIGGNDYKFSYSANYSASFVISTMIPLVIRQIHNTVEALLATGAKNFLFISITPLGCSSAVLSQENGTKDANGCLEEYNYASYVHGVRVLEEVERLRASYPHASFLFMDFYGAYEHVLVHHDLFGFSKTLQACCGVGDNYPYNYNKDEECNLESPFVCSNPSEYILWDGVHHTDSFHQQIFNQTILMGTYLESNSHASL